MLILTKSSLKVKYRFLGNGILNMMDNYPQIEASSPPTPSPHHYKLVGLISGFFISLMVIVGMFSSVGIATSKYGLGALAGLMIYGIPTLIAAPIIIIIAFFLGLKLDAAIKEGDNYQRPLLILDTVHDILGLLLGVTIASIFVFLILNGLSSNYYLDKILDNTPILLPLIFAFSYTFPFLYFISYVYLGLKTARLLHPLPTETVPNRQIITKLVTIFVLTLIAPIIIGTLSYLSTTRMKTLQDKTKLTNITTSEFTVQTDPNNGPYTEITSTGNVYIPEDGTFSVDFHLLSGSYYFGRQRAESVALSDSQIADPYFYLTKGWHKFQVVLMNEDCVGDPGMNEKPSKLSVPVSLQIELIRQEKGSLTDRLFASAKMGEFSEDQFFRHCPRPTPLNPVSKPIIRSILTQ